MNFHSREEIEIFKRWGKINEIYGPGLFTKEALDLSFGKKQKLKGNLVKGSVE